MLSEPQRVGGLLIDPELYRFVEEEALPSSGVDRDAFWQGLDEAVGRFGPEIERLLQTREDLQQSLATFHAAHPGQVEAEEHLRFLRSTGYLQEEPEAFTITTPDVDAEVAEQCGPQLVVPLLNARFATNAVNARWGSLYDALYGSDVIDRAGQLAPGQGYNPTRGAEVVRRVRDLLDEIAPLADGSHHDATGYAVDASGLVVERSEGSAGLADPSQLVGHRGPAATPEAIVLRHHGLHLEIRIDREHPIGSTDPAGVYDVELEAALTTIMDLEDSVAAVDVADKVLGYRNWLALMQGTLSERVEKAGTSFVRRMNPDRACVGLDGEAVTLQGRSLLFVRHVGHHLYSDAVVDARGRPVPEGILDAFMTVLGSCHDLRGPSAGGNSRAGSVYVVKPKLHGPAEVALTVAVFAAVEHACGLEPGTVKLGLMDEERRTSLNLAACIRAAADRIAFINTGFLDRTGDEIHTTSHAGPAVRKNDIRSASWISAYERANVEVGLACGLAGRAQIGKGMWAAPDDLAAMLEAKVAHPRSGASTAWVPSPTAAVLHALHYHQVDVPARQQEIARGGRTTATADLLVLALGDPDDWSREERLAEIDNNVQSTLGYVVRWVDAGVGCSKVPDLGGTPLMEDRATCRISSQHVSNWLLHGVVTAEDVEDSLRRMAVLVDEQNSADPAYRPMAPEFDGAAFQAARELLLDGLDQPNGYTEPILHRRRLCVKRRTA
jgi:malate synthase